MDNNLSISFVLPMFNERDNIRRTIDQIRGIAEKITTDYEIVVVDDASTDGSSDIVRDIQEKGTNIKLFCLEKNSKFGGAFAKGFEEAKKEIILYTDSDLPVTIEDIKSSIPLIASADIVTGYSKVKKGDTFRRKIISAVYNFIVEMLFGLNIKDINSGYKIVRRSAIKDLRFISRSPFVDVELFIHAKRKGLKVVQYPLIFQERLGGESYISRLPVIWSTFCDMIKVYMGTVLKVPPF